VEDGEFGMRRGLIVALGLAFVCSVLATEASAGSRHSRAEDALIKRYVSNEKCDERGAPAWGRASMHRWRAAQQRRHSR
jgi:hypothetical protein